MPDLVKIGMTTREPDERILELSSATGVPTPFILVYKRHFNNCRIAEEKMHVLLSENRISSSREFFNIPVYEAINILNDLQDVDSININIKTDNYSKSTASDLSDEVTNKALASFYGNDGELQDYLEAFDLFKKGTALNSPISMQYLGRMYLNGYGCKKNISIAVNHLNKSAKLGNMSAYAELGEIYLYHDKISNQTNAYNIWNIYLSSINHENYPLYSNDLIFVTKLLHHYHSRRNEIVFEQKDKLLYFKSDLLHYYQEDIIRVENLHPDLHWFLNENSRAKIEYLKNELF